MAKKKETSVEQKLRALYDLQLVDSRIDKIKNMRGELPLEVEDLEAEVAGLTIRLEKMESSIKEIEDNVKSKKLFISETEDRIKKYKKQQEKVRNNREYDALSKEIEYLELEIELAEKHIREFFAQTELKQESLEETKTRLDDKKVHLDHKKSELSNILKDTENEEKALAEESEKLKSKIDERLVKAYTRIRNSVKNGLAVVTIERGASGGSFFTIPPQVQVEIAARRKILTDEHSGRILVDQELAQEEEQRMQKVFHKM